MRCNSNSITMVGSATFLTNLPKQERQRPKLQKIPCVNSIPSFGNRLFVKRTMLVVALEKQCLKNRSERRNTFLRHLDERSLIYPRNKGKSPTKFVNSCKRKRHNQQPEGTICCPRAARHIGTAPSGTNTGPTLIKPCFLTNTILLLFPFISTLFRRWVPLNRLSEK